jgi:uncharacterized protein
MIIDQFRAIERIREINQKIILFTKYPRPGEVKTRLISTIGSDKACAIHKKMTLKTFALLQLLIKKTPVTLEIHYMGARLKEMQTWLGNKFNYIEQGNGSLGDKMSKAFSDSFTQGFKKIIIIGTDCPELNLSILKQSFNLLKRHDLILGPATDGGYYLIGLSRIAPSLFFDIPWSTEKVLNKTIEIAQKENLSYDLLQTLSDIDRKEDLKLWEKYSKINHH